MNSVVDGMRRVDVTFHSVWYLSVPRVEGEEEGWGEKIIVSLFLFSFFAGPTSSKAITPTATRQWPEISKEQRQTASVAGEQFLTNLLSPSIIHGTLEKISSVPATLFDLAM